MNSLSIWLLKLMESKLIASFDPILLKFTNDGNSITIITIVGVSLHMDGFIIVCLNESFSLHNSAHAR